MSWWCSARDVAWSWTWRPYVGVWVLVAALVAAYGWAIRGRSAGEAPPGVGRRVSFGLGVFAFWLAADWPLGALGSGYLASIHTVQYLLFTMVAPPLLLGGMPPAMLRRIIGHGWRRRAVAAFTRPLIAFAVFNVVLLGTHLPAVVDTLERSQLGSFAMDMLWLVSGFAFWWPVLSPLEDLNALSYPARLVFLVMNVFIPTVPASFLTFANYPLYGVYELAPPVGTLTAVQDQQLAGLTMKVAGGLIIFGAASVLFFRWFGAEEGGEI